MNGTVDTTPSPQDEVREMRAVVSRNMRARRRGLGLTQERLAELSGLSTEAIVKLENSKQWFSMESLAAVCRALSTTPCLLFLDPRRDHLVPVSEIIGLTERYSRPDPLHGSAEYAQEPQLRN